MRRRSTHGSMARWSAVISIAAGASGKNRIDRNVWSLLERFSNAEIASLVLPPHLVIEHAQVSFVHQQQGQPADA